MSTSQQGLEVPQNSRIETFHVSTYGCQMNLADSSTLVATLLTRGYRRVLHESEADLIILNTCSVREKAEQRVFGRLWELKRQKQQRPHVKLAVVGCMAQRLGAELIDRVPHVDFVLGTDRIFELPDILDGYSYSIAPDDWVKSGYMKLFDPSQTQWDSFYGVDVNTIDGEQMIYATGGGILRMLKSLSQE